MSTKPGLIGLLRRLLGDERGATAIEYAMIGVGISVAASTLVFSVGTSLNTNFFAKVLAAF